MGPVAAFRQPRGDLVAVCRRWQGEIAGRGRSKRHSRTGGDPSLRGRWVVWWMGQTPWGAVKMAVAGRATERGRGNRPIGGGKERGRESW